MTWLKRLVAFLSDGPRAPWEHGPPPVPRHQCHFHEEGEPWEETSKWCAKVRGRWIHGRCCICGARAIGEEIVHRKGIYGLWRRVA